MALEDLAYQEIEVVPANGTLAVVDRALFVEVVKYFAEARIIDEFNEYLETNNCYEVVIDVAIINHVKQFLLHTKRVKDERARLALLCSVDGTGGGGPSGVRG